MHLWLISHKHYGAYLENYEKNKSVPLFVKMAAIITMNSSIAFTAIIFIQDTWIRIMLFIIALAVSVHIATLKTTRDGSKD